MDDTLNTDFMDYKNWSNVTWCLVIIAVVLIAYILYNKFCNKKKEGYHNDMSWLSQNSRLRAQQQSGVEWPYNRLY